MASRFPSPRARLMRLLRLPEANQARAAEMATVVVTAEKVVAEVAIAVVAEAETADPDKKARAVSAGPDKRVKVVSAGPDKRVKVVNVDPDNPEKTAVREDPELLVATKAREDVVAEGSSVVDSEVAAREQNSLLLTPAEEKSEPAVEMVNSEVDSEEASVVVAVVSEGTEDLPLRVDCPDRVVTVLETMTATTLEAEVVREEPAQAVLVVMLPAAVPLSEFDIRSAFSSKKC